MIKNKSAKFILIDSGQLTRFKVRDKQRIGLPESILEEYSLTPELTMSDDNELPPMKQYQNAEGFEFAWGHILERRTEQYIVWDFCFNPLLIQYHRAGKRLNDLQRSAYHYLERKVACTTRDIVPVLSMAEGWKIIPCSTVGAFTLVIHFTQESDAREWVAYDLLTKAMPNLLEQLQRDINRDINKARR